MPVCTTHRFNHYDRCCRSAAVPWLPEMGTALALEVALAWLTKKLTPRDRMRDAFSLSAERQVVLRYRLSPLPFLYAAILVSKDGESTKSYIKAPSLFTRGF